MLRQLERRCLLSDLLSEDLLICDRENMALSKPFSVLFFYNLSSFYFSSSAAVQGLRVRNTNLPPACCAPCSSQRSIALVPVSVNVLVNGIHRKTAIRMMKTGYKLSINFEEELPA